MYTENNKNWIENYFLNFETWILHVVDLIVGYNFIKHRAAEVGNIILILAYR